MMRRASAGAWMTALLFFSVQLDLGIVLGAFTVYHNELLLALLLPLAALLASGSAGGRRELAAWAWAFLPLGLWLGLHALGPDSFWGGAKAALRAAQLACGLALPCMLLKSEADLKFALAAAMLAMLGTCLWAFAQSVAGPGAPINLGREAEVIHGFQAAAAGFGHHNQMGAFFTAAFCLCAAACISGTLRPLAMAALAAALTGLALSYSRGSWAGAMLAMLCFLPLLPGRARWAALGVALAGGLAVAFGPSGAFRERLLSLTADGNRAEHFRAVWKLWEGHAFWGWGAEGLDAQAKAAAATLLDLSDQGRASFSSHLHNTYLQIGLSWGWPALLGWLIFISAALRRLAGAWTHPAAKIWAVGLLGALLAFAFQASTDLLTLHARGLAVSLCWGLMLAAMKLASPEGRLAPVG